MWDKTTSLLLKRGTILGVRRLFTALSEIYVEGSFSQLTRTAFSRPYPSTPSHGFFFRLRALKENRLEADYVGCKFCDQSSIPIKCRISRDVDLEQVNLSIASMAFPLIRNTVSRGSPSLVLENGISRRIKYNPSHFLFIKHYLL